MHGWFQQDAHARDDTFNIIGEVPIPTEMPEEQLTAILIGLASSEILLFTGGGVDEIKSGFLTKLPSAPEALSSKTPIATREDPAVTVWAVWIR